MSIGALMPRDEAPPAAVRGRIANTPAAEDDDLFVTIDVYDRQQRFGPCAFAPRGEDLPSRGDRCLVLFDELREPWVVLWTP